MNSINNEFKTGLNMTRVSNERYDLIAQLTFKIKMLELLSNGIIQNNNTLEDNEATLRSEVNTQAYQILNLNRY